MNTDSLKLKKIGKVERFSFRPTNDQETGIIKIPGSGISRRLLDSLDADDVSCIMLVKFCSEGDNTQDAFDLANKFNDVTKIKEPSKGTVNWIVPYSWRALYGGDAPYSMY